MRIPRFGRWGALAVLLVLPLGLSTANPKPSPNVTASTAITGLAWLAGQWRMEKGGRVIDEQWMAPAGGVMLGMARTVAKGKVVEHEFLQIREGPGGTLFYVAAPSGQPETAFQLLTLTDTEAVFENRLYDFPQRISYTRQADGSLLAVIEGPNPDGTTKRSEFPYQRIQP
jgi:hypothetical protein